MLQIYTNFGEKFGTLKISKSNQIQRILTLLSASTILKWLSDIFNRYFLTGVWSQSLRPPIFYEQKLKKLEHRCVLYQCKLQPFRLHPHHLFRSDKWTSPQISPNLPFKFKIFCNFRENSEIEKFSTISKDNLTNFFNDVYSGTLFGASPSDISRCWCFHNLFFNHWPVQFQTCPDKMGERTFWILSEYSCGSCWNEIRSKE